MWFNCEPKLKAFPLVFSQQQRKNYIFSATFAPLAKPRLGGAAGG